jgi:hypothetical protein
MTDSEWSVGKMARQIVGECSPGRTTGDRAPRPVIP